MAFFMTAIVKLCKHLPLKKSVIVRHSGITLGLVPILAYPGPLSPRYCQHFERGQSQRKASVSFVIEHQRNTRNQKLHRLNKESIFKIIFLFFENISSFVLEVGVLCVAARK